jgi:two-component system, chemotaxis family, response regulator WspF
MRIGIVSERASAVQTLERAVALAAAHRVIWIANAADDAMERCTTNRPDLLLMDLAHTGMTDGVELVRRIMTKSPCAILMLTDNITVSAGRVFEAMGHGAMDAVDMPATGSSNPEAAAPLLAKLGTMARLVGEKRGRPGSTNHESTPRRERAPLVAIGASAGGPAALATLLSHLPEHFGGAIVIVQHVDASFAAGMTQWLSRHSSLPVRLAFDGDRPEVGTVLLAGTSDHLVFNATGELGYTPEPRSHVYRPSVDVFFDSATRVWRGDAIGVLLTGMGKDGAVGLKAFRDRGHHTIAQDAATSAVYGMPKAAAALGAAVEILPIEQIAPRLFDLVGARRGYGSEN